MADSTGRYTSTFDAVGQTMVTASPDNQRQAFSYDTVGQRRSMDVNGAGRFTYQYDAANQISSLRNPYTERTTFAYDDAGRRNVQRNANGTRVSLSYDAASQTTQVFHRTSAGASVLQLDYKYDPAGNRKSMAENGAAARTTWTYDKQNQLLGEYRTGTNPYRQTFTYDPAGNRTLKNVDTVRTTYAYDVANQLKYGQAVAGRTSFAYDATGNQRIEQPPTGNRTTTTWNYENQPTQYRLPAGSPVTMTYNGDNRRVISQQGATSNKFVWDATTDAYLSELDGTNAVQAVYTNEPQQFGSILSQRRSSTSHWLHADALGTTRLLTSSTQTTTDTYLLDAWGNPISGTGTTVNPFRWVGRYGYYQDTTTGLVYVRARMYMPMMARWVNIDPLWLNDDSNWYSYAQNSPCLGIDPDGRRCMTEDGLHFKKAGNAHAWFEGSERELGRWQSEFDLRWTADPDVFKGTGCCECCCTKVGFIQIFRTTATGANTWFINKWWRIDAAIPYPIGGPESFHLKGSRVLETSGNPCTRPPLKIAMYDRPGIPPRGKFGIINLLTYKQPFETCVVCLEGCDSPRLESEGILDETGPHIQRLVTYGCIQWEHSFTRGEGDDVIVNLQVNGRNLGTIELRKDQVKPTWYNVSLGQRGSAVELQPPSRQFRQTLDGNHNWLNIP